MRTILTFVENGFQTGLLLRGSSLRHVIVVNRFRVPLERGEEFRDQAQAAYEVLADQHGFESGGVGRNLDDPELWVLHTQWRDVGSYRRALSTYEAKLTAVPVLSLAVDEPSAYEAVVPGAVLNDARARSLG